MSRPPFDGVETNGYDANLNPFPYALADFYNHSMRYPREQALHDLRVAAVEQRGLAVQEPLDLDVLGVADGRADRAASHWTASPRSSGS